MPTMAALSADGLRRWQWPAGTTHVTIFADAGLPGMQALNRLRIGETVEEVLQADLELEFEAIALLKDAIEHCEKVRDFASRDLFAEILSAEEEHVDFIETQQEMIRQMGLANYIQLQSRPAGD
jgi:bacterioferritin